MKILRFFLSAGLLLIGAKLAFADGVPPDPKITLGGGGSCQSFSETSLTQSFTGVNTGCVVDFTNNIATDEGSVIVHTLVVSVDTPFTGALSCALGLNAPLNTAFVSSANSCTFLDETPESITPGLTYSLTFVNPNAIGGGFPALIDITLEAQNVTPAPEPATLFLLGVGLAGLLAGRTRLKIAKTGLV